MATKDEQFLEEGIRRYKLARQTIDSFDFKICERLEQLLGSSDICGPYDSNREKIKTAFNQDAKFLWFHARFSSSGKMNKIGGNLMIDISWRLASDEVLCGIYFEPDAQNGDKTKMLDKIRRTTLKSPYLHIPGYLGIQVPFESIGLLESTYKKLSVYFFDILK